MANLLTNSTDSLFIWSKGFKLLQTIASASTRCSSETKICKFIQWKCNSEFIELFLRLTTLVRVWIGFFPQGCLLNTLYRTCLVEVMQPIWRPKKDLITSLESKTTSISFPFFVKTFRRCHLVFLMVLEMEWCYEKVTAVLVLVAWFKVP